LAYAAESSAKRFSRYTIAVAVVSRLSVCALFSPLFSASITFHSLIVRSSLLYRMISSCLFLVAVFFAIMATAPDEIDHLPPGTVFPFQNVYAILMYRNIGWSD
jgi:hypothetical protein